MQNSKFEKLDFSALDWVDVMSRFGVEVGAMKAAKHYPCPIEQNDPKPRFRFDNKDGKGTWICSNCGSGNGVRFVALVEGVDDIEAIRRIRAKFEDNGAVVVPTRKTPVLTSVKTEPERTWMKQVLQVMWDESKDIVGTPVQKYLERRVPGLDIKIVSPMLRYHPRLEYRDEETGQVIGHFPAMIGKAVDMAGVPITLHRTYLTPDGFKASVAEVKKQMPGARKLNGDAIRLNVPKVFNGVLIVCEGIETGFALATSTHNLHETWSMMNAGNLAKSQIPKRFHKVIIAADRDKICLKGYRPGEHYAELLHQRIQKDGFNSVLRVPEEEGVDFCDLWSRMMSAA